MLQFVWLGWFSTDFKLVLKLVGVGLEDLEGWCGWGDLGSWNGLGF